MSLCLACAGKANWLVENLLTAVAQERIKRAFSREMLAGCNINLTGQ